MRRFLHDNGLAIVAFALFIAFWAGMSIAGYFDYNQEQREHGLAQLPFLPYLLTGHFWEATFENWESEYLQMGLFVLLTAYFFQKGSAESRSEEEREQEQQEEEQEQREHVTSEGGQVPGPVERGGLAKKLYENSLSIALLSLFLLSFALHAVSGAAEYNEQQALAHQPPISAWQFLGTSEFWFQSLQNWQSEFLAVGSMVVLTIYLRQKGSAESKRVGAPHGETGA